MEWVFDMSGFLRVLPCLLFWGSISFVAPIQADESKPYELEISEADYKQLRNAVKSKQESSIVEAASKILGRDSKNIAALSTLAIFYFDQGKTGLARLILNRALADHPAHPGLLNNLGIVLLTEGKQRQAIISFRRAIEAKSDYRIAPANLAAIYLEYKDYTKAIEPLEAAHQATVGEISKGSQTAIDLANNYALALMGVGKYAEADSVFSKVTSTDAKTVDVLLNHVILLVDFLKKGKAAMAVINKIKFLTESSQVIRKIEELENKARQME